MSNEATTGNGGIPQKDVKANISPRPPRKDEIPEKRVYAEAVGMLESRCSAVLVVDSEGTIRYLSPTASAWLHYKAETLEHNYKVSILMPADENGAHLERFIPQVVSGAIPSRPMAGGRFVPVVTRLGDHIMVQIGYQNINIHGHPYAIIVLCKKNRMETVVSSWQGARTIMSKCLVTITAVVSVITVLSSALAPHMVEKSTLPPKGPTDKGGKPTP